MKMAATVAAILQIISYVQWFNLVAGEGLEPPTSGFHILTSHLNPLICPQISGRVVCMSYPRPRQNLPAGFLIRLRGIPSRSSLPLRLHRMRSTSAIIGFRFTQFPEGSRTPHGPPPIGLWVAGNFIAKHGARAKN